MSAEQILPRAAGRGLSRTGEDAGPVVALDGVKSGSNAGEILAVIGDNGAGKSTLIKCLTGAMVPAEAGPRGRGSEVSFRRPQDAHAAGIETVYQTLARAPALDIASNMFLGREIRRRGPLGGVLRMLDHKRMRQSGAEQMSKLGIRTLQDITQVVETLSGGQRQAVAIARAVAFGAASSCSTSRRLRSACGRRRRCSMS